jgi:hypothetical protein
MLKSIPTRFTANLMLLIFSAMIGFHLLVLSGIIPFEIVWGGRLQNRQQMISFELISILINVIMLAVMAIYAGYVKVRISSVVINGVLWIMFVMFFLNTIGNLFSHNDLEKMIFTPITVLLSLGCLQLAINK